MGDRHLIRISKLGFRLERREGKEPGDHPRYLRLLRPKSEDKIKEGIRNRTKRTNGQSLKGTIQGPNRMLRGWFGYYRSAHQNIHRKLDKMIRRRLRAILAKRQGGTPSGMGSCHSTWQNAFFAGMGLFSLEEAHVQFAHPWRGNR